MIYLWLAIGLVGLPVLTMLAVPDVEDVPPWVFRAVASSIAFGLLLIFVGLVAS